MLPQSERRRIVDSWVVEYPASWASICRAIEDDGLAERTLVASAVPGAITDRQPPPSIVMQALEAGDLRRSPGAALALAISPASVWEREIVYEAIRISDGPDDMKAFADDVEAFAYDSLETEHRDRVVRQAARIDSSLPLENFPAASRTLRAGCELVLGDPGAQEAVVALLLVAYARLLEAQPGYVTSAN
jgi:hypothetical protein